MTSNSNIDDLFPCISCGVNADPADGFGKCTCGNEAKREAIQQELLKARQAGFDEGYNHGRNIHPKYEVGDIGGYYKITERFRRVGKNTKYKVICTLCGAPMFRYSNKFKLKHKDCKADLQAQIKGDDK